MALGLVGPELSLWLTAFPAVVAALAIAAVVVIPRLGPGPSRTGLTPHGCDAGSRRRHAA